VTSTTPLFAQTINLEHELVQLAARIVDWIDREVTPLYGDEGRSRIETRFVIGLKHINGLSDESVCERRVYDHYSSASPMRSFSSRSSRTGATT
jgi:hypothetical protein